MTKQNFNKKTTTGLFEIIAPLYNYLSELNIYPTLTADEELELAKVKEKGGPDAEDAFNKLVTSHLRQVVSIVSRDFAFRGNISVMDKIQAGNLGLIKAVQNFDWRKGNRLSTYADWWIHAYIVREIHNNNNIIRIPERAAHEIHKVLHVQDEYIEKNGKKPSLEKIAELTNLSVARVKDILTNATKTLSYDELITNEDGDSTSHLDFIPDPNENNNPYHVTEQKINHEKIKNILKLLPANEALVLQLYFGLGHTPMTLSDIAKLPNFNCTRQYIQQLKDRAILHFREFYFRK